MAIKVSKGREANAVKYKNEKRQEKNRLRKLQALAKIQPNNEQIALAIKNVHYRRHTPKAEVWGHQEKRVAQLVKYFSGKFDKDYFNVDHKKQHAAAMVHVENKFKRQDKKGVLTARYPNVHNGSMFSIGARIMGQSNTWV